MTAEFDFPSEVIVESSALALIDSMDDNLLFTPGKVTDEQLAAMRSDWLAEAKKYDISTEAKRTELKRFARPLQKLRTGIEARSKELTGATKRKIAAIDTEKRRLVQIVGGIEDDVLAPLIAWEQEEEARKIRLAEIVNGIAENTQPHLYPTIDHLELAIAALEKYDTSTMQEYKVSAESAIAASLKVLKPELERRRVAEANEAELAKLRAESAARAEQDRLAAVTKQIQERVELEAQERERAAEQRAKDAEAKAKADAEAAVEAERKRVADAAKREQEGVAARAADAKHRAIINNEVRKALFNVTLLDDSFLDALIESIAKGLIPHVRIEY